jgi:hypothetical protein
MAPQYDDMLNNNEFNMYDGPEVSWPIAATDNPEEDEWNQFWYEWRWLHPDDVPNNSLYMEGMPPPGVSGAQAETPNVQDRMGDPRPMTENDPMVDFDVDFNIMDETLSWPDNIPGSSTPSLSWTTQTDCSAPASSNPVTHPCPIFKTNIENHLPPSVTQPTVVLLLPRDFTNHMSSGKPRSTQPLPSSPQLANAYFYSVLLVGTRSSIPDPSYAQ